jgi:hypothetical protein
MSKKSGHCISISMSVNPYTSSIVTATYTVQQQFIKTAKNRKTHLKQ